MSANKYIVTNSGFVKDFYAEYDSDLEEYFEEIIYTDKLRKAKCWSKKKSAENFLENHLDGRGFIYHPYEEENIERCYEVKLCQLTFMIDDIEGGQVYAPKKVNQGIISDAIYLQDRSDFRRDDLLTKKEAERKSRELNKELLEELTRRFT